MKKSASGYKKVKLNGWLSAADAIDRLAETSGRKEANRLLYSKLLSGDISLAAQIAVQESATSEVLHERYKFLTDIHLKTHPFQSEPVFLHRASSRKYLVRLPCDFFAENDSWVINKDLRQWPSGWIIATKPSEIRPKRTKVTLPSGETKSILIDRATGEFPPLKIRRILYSIHFCEDEVSTLRSQSIRKIPDGSDGNTRVKDKKRKPTSRGRPRKTDTDENERTPAGDTSVVMEEFHDMIRSGEFQKLYPNPYAFGVRALIARNFSKRMEKRGMYPPSAATLRRKAESLAQLAQPRSPDRSSDNG